jgi:6-phosphogluconolactonase
MILGMGGDGHFASLFPASTTLREGLDLDNPNSVIAVDPPVAPHARMSMTLRRILDCHSLILHIVGEDKREIVDAALKQGDPEVLPIVAVLRSEAPAPAIYWAA